MTNTAVLSRRDLTDRQLLRVLYDRTGFDFADLTGPGCMRILNDERDEHLRDLPDPVRALDATEIAAIRGAEWNFHDTEDFLASALTLAVQRRTPERLHSVSVKLVKAPGESEQVLLYGEGQPDQPLTTVTLPQNLSLVGEFFDWIRTMARQMADDAKHSLWGGSPASAR